MDIMRLPLEGQVSPAPWLVARSRVDASALIRKALAIHPNAGTDKIVRQLAAWGMQVSGIIVSMWMMRWKGQAERAKPDEKRGNAASKEDVADLYRTCSEESCTCQKPAAPWSVSTAAVFA